MSGSRPTSLQGGARSTDPQRPKVLLVIGDGAEVMDTLFPFYRLGEEYNVVVAGPERKVYHLVIHELAPGWDITEERLGYHLEPDITFADVDPAEYAGLVLPGGRAPEYLRYDEDLLRITRHFFETQKPTASICHGIEILATAGVLKGRTVATIPKCRFDAEVCGATFVKHPVVRDGHMICCRGKKDMSAWMKEFVSMLDGNAIHPN
ncbi:MAG: DJ-1/PfpI family protein [Planctomycetota bacterium]|nr:DJ-1/PfpI family protein [Planctomycetota bacterium]MDA1211950.1 DJ-1/PfpI family protein [Planctomycetota bacterium]